MFIYQQLQSSTHQVHQFELHTPGSILHPSYTSIHQKKSLESQYELVTETLVGVAFVHKLKIVFEKFGKALNCKFYSRTKLAQTLYHPIHSSHSHFLISRARKNFSAVGRASSEREKV
jgi:hypothetical protein